MKILNIHGFDSHGENSKKKWLEETFPECEIISPTLPPVPKRAYEILKEIILDNEIDLFVGSSLGGFYAWFFSQKFETPAILLNPALNAFYDLRHRLGRGVNPKTGMTYHFTEEDLKYLGKMFSKAYPSDYPFFKIYLAEEDEVLPFHYIKEIYKDHVTCGPFGTHRFENVDLITPEVIKIFENKKNIFNDESL